MKLLLPFLLGMLPFVVLAQQENPTKQILLKDGSIIKGQIEESPFLKSSIITLLDGSRIELPDSLLLSVRKVKGRELIFMDGRRMLSKGRYTTLSIHSLSGKRRIESSDEKRWAFGGHFSTGYSFNTWFSLGGGIGLDFHEFTFMPVFMEVSGYFVKKEFSESVTKKSHGRELSTSEITGPKRRFPFCYSLQIGYNVPIREILDTFDDQELSGGALIYPSLGFMFPSRFGSTFRLDVGYKFQGYKIFHNLGWWWNNYEVKDAITLRSFAMRASCFF